MSTIYFVTGTDTDAGKTLVSSALLLKAQQQGLTTFGLKPVAAGCDWSDADSQWQNQDALLLQKYSTTQHAYRIHNPVALRTAIAPHIAAEQQGINLSVQQLVSDCQQGLTTEADFRLIEGAGGWLVPLNDTETLADFAIELQAHIILVAGLKLGCISHTLMSAQLIQRSGLRLAGWIANSLSGSMPAQDENLAFLHQWFSAQQVPCLGHIPFQQNCQQPEVAHKVIRYIQLPDDEQKSALV